MKKTVLDPRSLILAPIVLLIGYLISLPVYYFGLVWHDGMYTFYVENIYICVFGLIGFLGFDGSIKSVKTEVREICICVRLCLYCLSFCSVFRERWCMQ